jgi:hypothetical protein
MEASFGLRDVTSGGRCLSYRHPIRPSRYTPSRVCDFSELERSLIALTGVCRKRAELVCISAAAGREKRGWGLGIRSEIYVLARV